MAALFNTENPLDSRAWTSAGFGSVFYGFRLPLCGLRRIFDSGMITPEAMAK